MKKIRANVCAVTHAGRIRRENEDNYSLNGRLTSTGDLKKGSAFVQSMNEPFHLAVCDGMGGESYGELASGIAAETIVSHASNVYESGEDFSFAISNCIVEANNRICDEITARGKRMGTTVATVYAVKGKLYCVNIGDSRIYHYSKGILEQISFDHTHAQTMVDAGQAMMDNMSAIPDAKKLTRHLGIFPYEGNLTPNISVIDDVDDGDIILVCSDGLTDMVSDDDISALLAEGENAQALASKLIRLALERGGKDNVTVMAANLSVEETAIFAPIAAAMVGDSDADYRDEYYNSYGGNIIEDEENPVSPYVNADANAYKKPVDKNKIIIIAGVVIGVIILAIFAAAIFKSVLGKDDENAGKKKDPTTVKPSYSMPVQTTVDPLLTTTDVTETTTEPETEEEEEDDTTRRPNRPSSTRPPETEPEEEPTEDEPSTEEPSSDEPSSDEPSSDEPSTDEPSSEEPSSEAPSDPPANGDEGGEDSEDAGSDSGNDSGAETPAGADTPES